MLLHASGNRLQQFDESRGQACSCLKADVCSHSHSHSLQSCFPLLKLTCCEPAILTV